MANKLHFPPRVFPTQRGDFTRPWKEWFRDIKRLIVNRASTFVENNLVSFDSVGDLKDSGIAAEDVLEIDDVLGTVDRITVTNNGNGTITLDVDESGIDHGLLLGIGDDDHTQYLLAAGSRALSGNMSIGNNKLTDLASATGGTDAANLNDAEEQAIIMAIALG